MPNIKTEYFNSGQVAELLGVSRSFITKLKQQGRFPSGYTFDKREYYSKQAIYEWIETRRKPRKTKVEV